MATVKKVKKAQRGGCVSNMSGSQRQRYFQGGPSPLQKAGQAIKDVFSGGKTKEERQEARAQRKASRAAKKMEANTPAKSGKTIKKAQRGGCVSGMSSGERTNFFRGGTEGQIRRAGNKQLREIARDERKEARAEKRAARKAAPPAKHGIKVKKAQDGRALRDTTDDAKNRKQSPALTEMGKKTTRAAINKRTDEMAKSLDRASVFGKNYIAPGDSAKKKAVNKPVPKKKMMNGGKAKKMMSGGKCKYGC
jgi:hypothetical protein